MKATRFCQLGKERHSDKGNGMRGGARERKNAVFTALGGVLCVPISGWWQQEMKPERISDFGGNVAHERSLGLVTLLLLLLRLYSPPPPRQ